MKLAYQFFRDEINRCDISYFQALFGLERLQERISQKPDLRLVLIGSMRIKFEQDKRGLFPYEDLKIRKLCKKLFAETAAAFLEEPPEGAFSALFLSTLTDFTTVTFERMPEHVRFDADREKIFAHGIRFQERILETADSLGVGRALSERHCINMRSPLHQ